ncbi:MAG: PAS domain-containing protein [Acidimicrobiia bacterium]|nr:PAS domain-containing protein [Acidimicrobiia bacterium]
MVVTDLEGRIELWSRHAEELFGWAEEEVLGRDISEILVPVDQHASSAAIVAQVRGGQDWTGEFTVRRKDGEAIPIWVADRPVINRQGEVIGVIGVSEDLVEHQRVSRVAEELSERLQLALEAGGLGTFQWDMVHDVVSWDDRVHSLFGVRPETFDGTYEAYLALLHPEDREASSATVQDAVATGAPYTLDHRVVWPDGSVHWIHGAGHITLGPDGEATGAIGVVADVTEERRNREQLQKLTLDALEAADRERVSSERLEFLGRVNDALAAATDQPSLMRNVVAAAVPRLGDWCSIFVLPPGGSQIPEVEVAHPDPAMVAYARELMERFPYDPDAPFGAPRVIRTGEPELITDVTALDPDAAEVGDEAQEVLERLQLRSVITVPLIKRSRVLGALQLVMSRAGRQYGAEDLALAQAVGVRIASSLQNQRLSDEQRHIAKTLQASLLPRALPKVPDLDIAVRYWARGEGVDVGGDFYDIFEVRDGLWAFVLGDVCGSGPQAAATAGLLRHTIATSAWHGDPPEQVLHSLNSAMRNRDAGPFCTVLYGTVEATGAGPRLTVVCGGHPLPVLVGSDGIADQFGTPGTLIGPLARIDVTATSRLLQPGDTLVAYTDGATDLPPPHGLNETEVTKLVGSVVSSDSTAEQVADGMHRELHRIRPIDERNDDIALLVLRATAPD